MLKSFLNKLFQSAMNGNKRNILKFVKGTNPSSFLDLGCDEGTWTLKVAESAQAKSICGIEIVEERADQARKKSIQVTIADLAQKLPFANDTFDLVHSNQVIEHVPDVDLFASEIMRVLKPRGIAVISTENGSSWHNIFAAVMGWQIFSLTNMSGLKSGIGNPIALHRNESLIFKTWTHKVIFNYRGFIEFFEAHGFIDVEVRGSGYYPLPSFFGALDPRHAHFITAVVKKPN